MTKKIFYFTGVSLMDLAEMYQVRYVCRQRNCNKTFKNEASLNTHVRDICNQPPRFKCGYCRYRSRKITDIKRHLIRCHPGLESNIVKLHESAGKSRPRNPPVVEKFDFSCVNANCSRKFRTKSNLIYHVNYECGKLPRFKCNYCDFKHYFKSVIKKHTLTKHPDQEYRFVVTESYYQSLMSTSQ